MTAEEKLNALMPGIRIMLERELRLQQDRLSQHGHDQRKVRQYTRRIDELEVALAVAREESS